MRQKIRSPCIRVETYLSLWVRKKLQNLSRKGLSCLHIPEHKKQKTITEHKFNEHLKKSHTLLSVATRNIPGSEIPAPHPIVIPSKIATCINAHKIIQIP